MKSQPPLLSHSEFSTSNTSYWDLQNRAPLIPTLLILSLGINFSSARVRAIRTRHSVHRILEMWVIKGSPGWPFPILDLQEALIWSQSDHACECPSISAGQRCLTRPQKSAHNLIESEYWLPLWGLKKTASIQRRESLQWLENDPAHLPSFPPRLSALVINMVDSYLA